MLNKQLRMYWQKAVDFIMDKPREEAKLPTLEQIAEYDLSELNLVLPDWVREFRASPYHGKKRMASVLGSALRRYNELTHGGYLIYDRESGDFIPTEKDCEILERLERLNQA